MSGVDSYKVSEENTYLRDSLAQYRISDQNNGGTVTQRLRDEKQAAQAGPGSSSKPVPRSQKYLHDELERLQKELAELEKVHATCPGQKDEKKKEDSMAAMVAENTYMV